MFIPILTLFLAMISIQFGASLAKQLFPVLGVAGTTTLRIGFAAILLCLLWKPWNKSLNSAEKKTVFMYGSSLGVMNMLFYLALERIPLGIAVALEFTGPLAVALFSSRRSLDFVWAVLAIVGIVLILPVQEVSQALDPLGIFLALGAGACWALYIVFGQKISRTVPGGVASSIGMTIAALVALPFGLLSAGTNLIQISTLPMALAVALLSSAIPYSLEMISLKALPARTFGILMSLEPAIAALAGFLFLSEKLDALQMLAIGCVMAASAGSTWTAEKAVPPIES